MKRIPRQLPWHNTHYNRSLQVSTEDNKFLLKLISNLNKTNTPEERDKCREIIEFYLEFHRDASTNNNNSDWGRARRQARRLDIYNDYRELLGLSDVTLQGDDS